MNLFGITKYNIINDSSDERKERLHGPNGINIILISFKWWKAANKKKNNNNNSPDSKPETLIQFHSINQMIKMCVHWLIVNERKMKKRMVKDTIGSYRDVRFQRAEMSKFEFEIRVFCKYFGGFEISLRKFSNNFLHSSFIFTTVIALLVKMTDTKRVSTVVVIDSIPEWNRLNWRKTYLL